MHWKINCKTRACCNDILKNKQKSASTNFLFNFVPWNTSKRYFMLEMSRKITQCSEIIMTQYLSFLWNNLPDTAAEALSLQKSQQEFHWGIQHDEQGNPFNEQLAYAISCRNASLLLSHGSCCSWNSLNQRCLGLSGEKRDALSLSRWWWVYFHNLIFQWSTPNTFRDELRESEWGNLIPYCPRHYLMRWPSTGHFSALRLHALLTHSPSCYEAQLIVLQ